MKRVLIAGANSYIGNSFKAYLESFPDEYTVEKISTRGLDPSPEQFTGYDAVFCVAGIAHIKETKENRHLYYEINRDLVVSIARAAKKAGVKQFVLLSSMAVYGVEEGCITKDTRPNPITAYGESKFQADEEIKRMADSDFLFTCLRPPMVYGKNCPGNYQALRKFALNSPIFPDIRNQRSMIYIGNLCKFAKDRIDSTEGGLFFPQNSEYVNTGEMIRKIAECNNRKIRPTGAFNRAIRIAPLNTVKKAFGSLIYEAVDTVEYFTFSDSILATETE